MNVAKQCPWCERWCLKDNACNYIFACGLPADGSKFVVGTGCGRSWCWECGKKFCTQYIVAETGIRSPTAKDVHDTICCRNETNFSQETYCGGGHNSHCEKRW